MSNSIRKALDRIESGQPVAWGDIKTKIHRAGIDQELVQKAFDVVVYGDGVSQVEIADQTAFADLKAAIEPVNKSNRSSASLKGDTHVTGVNGALLAVWEGGKADCFNRVFRDDLPFPVPRREHAFIIENEECFLYNEKTFDFARSYCGIDHAIEEVEFIYGAGNSISNRRFIPYLKNFKGDILCLLDVDAGGLTTFINLLSAGIDQEKIRFLVPFDLLERLKRSQRVATKRELDRLDSLYGTVPVVDELIRAIKEYEKTIEQEGYRAHG